MTWQYPLINVALRVADPIEYLVRLPKGLRHLPRFSVRARSNGIRRQFGGENFARYGQIIAGLLQMHAGMRRHSKVLEIGCGCGRTAIALSKVLDGGYIGMDIERVSLEACIANPALRHFRFDLLDVQNDAYNRSGKRRAAEYVFPYADSSFDVIFLVSVFTHMKTDDVRNYVREILRVLKPTGICMLTALLMDRGQVTPSTSFPYGEQEHYFFNRELPEIAIGYYSSFFAEAFGALPYILWGHWRNDPAIKSITGFPQDVLLFSK